MMFSLELQRSGKISCSHGRTALHGGTGELRKGPAGHFTGFQIGA
jgi:hypothetical protein